jgi:hypothetical protein
MATGNMIYDHAAQAIEWLNPMVYLFGLGIASWAFCRCRKWGYLLVAIYFALAVFSLLAMPSINRAIRAHEAPDYDAQTRQKIAAAVQKVLVEEGRPESIPHGNIIIHFPFGPILLVAGLWLVVKRDTPWQNSAQQQSAK